MKDSTGTLKAERIEKDTRGLVILSTHTGYRLDHELSTRVLSQELTHDKALARQVYRQKARQTPDSDIDPFRIWQVADAITEPKRVKIPFLSRLADLFPTDQERYHRDYEKVIALIKASALWHQYQREEEDGAILANQEDYRLVFGLSSVFTQSTLSVSTSVLSFLNLIQSNPEMTRADVEKSLSVSERSLRRYIEQAVKAGFVETEGRGTKQTFRVIEIPEPHSVLPAPDDIFSSFSSVQLSDLPETIPAQGKESDKGNCPVLASCPELANRTESDKGGCPINSVANRGDSCNWPIGQDREDDFDGQEANFGTVHQEPAKRCPVCKETDFWTSVKGIMVCRRCHPPAPGAELRQVITP